MQRQNNCKHQVGRTIAQNCNKVIYNMYYSISLNIIYQYLITSHITAMFKHYSLEIHINMLYFNKELSRYIWLRQLLLQFDGL